MTTTEDETADMPDAGEPQESSGADETQDAPKPRGRGLAVFAILLALLAGGGAGYLYYELIYKNPLDAAAATQATEVAQLRSEIGQIEVQQAKALDTVIALETDISAKLVETEKGVRDSLASALQAAPPSQREWKLAEAEYLLRIANHRVLMEQDANGALQLLLAADQILEELDDFALHGIRARLADEIIALKNVPRDDLQGMYLRLEAAKGQLANARYTQPDVRPLAPPEPTLTVWEQLVAATQEFVRVRRLTDDNRIKPLLAPQESVYLELQLRLLFEQAQLAVLKRHQDVYEQSLTNIRQHIQDYFVAEEHATQVLLDEVESLLKFELQRPLPDVSASLSELLKIRRGGE